MNDCKSQMGLLYEGVVPKSGNSQKFFKRSTGILEAIDEVKTMSLSKWARAQYDAYRKQVMDRKAREDYVRDEGRAESENRIAILVEKMTAAGEADKLPQLSQKDFLHKMLEKYDLMEK